MKVIIATLPEEFGEGWEPAVKGWKEWDGDHLSGDHMEDGIYLGVGIPLPHIRPDFDAMGVIRGCLVPPEYIFPADAEMNVFFPHRKKGYSATFGFVGILQKLIFSEVDHSTTEPSLQLIGEWLEIDPNALQSKFGGIPHAFNIDEALQLWLIISLSDPEAPR